MRSKNFSRNFTGQGKRRLLWTIYVVLLFSWLSTSCTRDGGPTHESLLPPPQHFLWQGGAVTAEQKEYAETSWAKISACVGLNDEVMQNFKIQVKDAPQGLQTWPWPLYCNDPETPGDDKNIAACGCSHPFTRIEIVNTPECFQGGLPTELMHQALWMHGEDGGYGNPKFTSCRWW